MGAAQSASDNGGAGNGSMCNSCNCFTRSANGINRGQTEIEITPSKVQSHHVVDSHATTRFEAPAKESGPGGYYVAGDPLAETWRYNNPQEDKAVGVGAYFGRIEGQTDNVARVKTIVAGGAAEQCGLIRIGDALLAVDGVDVYGAPLSELGKRVLGPSGSVVKLTFARYVEPSTLNLQRQGT